MTKPSTPSPSWEDWPEQISRQAADVVALVRAGTPNEALGTLDRMIADLDDRRAVVSDLANALD
jgi:hypothetical protein